MPWDSDRVLQQLTLGEDSSVEFKEATFSDHRVRAPHRDALADELAAFGNTIGGTLIFSVSDAGEVRSMNRQQMDALEAFVGGIGARRNHFPYGSNRCRGVARRCSRKEQVMCPT